MERIADIIVMRNGKVKVRFFELGIYEVLKNEFGYRYVKIDGKGYYYKHLEDGGIQSVNFFELADSFRLYIERNFHLFGFNNLIEYKTFLNAFYHYRPIKNGNFARSYLKDKSILSEEEKNQISSS